MRIDLHLHSTASDGTLTPSELVQAAVAARLDVIALTDHDTVAGVPAALDAAAGLPIEVIPGIEVSSTLDGREIHILGYRVDTGSDELLTHTDRARTLRQGRILGMIDRLAEQDIEVPFEIVLELAGPERETLGRPHLARALVELGFAESVPDAFDRWIGDHHPAFLPTQLLEPEEAVGLIARAGGVAVWAHPPTDLLDGLLPRLCQAGLKGLEVYRPRVQGERLLRLERIARSAGLIRTGGSDWHGPATPHGLGEFWVTEEEVGELL